MRTRNIPLLPFLNKAVKIVDFRFIIYILQLESTLDAILLIIFKYTSSIFHFIIKIIINILLFTDVTINIDKSSQCFRKHTKYILQ